MAHDAGNLEQAIKGKTLAKFLVGAMFLFSLPWLIKSCSSSEDADDQIQERMVSIGSLNGPELLEIELSPEWSPWIHIAPGNYFSIDAPENSYVEVQAAGAGRSFMIYYGQGSVDLGTRNPNPMFRLRGEGGTATVTTTPLY